MAPTPLMLLATNNLRDNRNNKGKANRARALMLQTPQQAIPVMGALARIQALNPGFQAANSRVTVLVVEIAPQVT